MTVGPKTAPWPVSATSGWPGSVKLGADIGVPYDPAIVIVTGSKWTPPSTAKVAGTVGPPGWPTGMTAAGSA
jgi:hypothetical protein